MHFVDHIFIFLLVAVYPVVSTWSYQREVKMIEAGHPANRMSMYLSTGIIEWLALAGLLTAWFSLGRPLSDLGFVAPGGAGFYIGVVLLVATFVWQVRQWRTVAQLTEAERQEQVVAIGKLAHFLPHNRREVNAIYGLSLTAGIVEEVIYRGFVIWYLSLYMPMWSAVLLSSIIFGASHSYQGVSGAVRCGMIGLAFAGLYLLTGSIWLPMLGHFLFDALQVPAAFELLRAKEPPKQEVPA